MSGVYIHIPFCRKACHYCNFHFSTSLRLKDELIAALVNEIRLTPAFSNGSEKEICETVYFGGGTPSILEPDDLSLLFDALREKFLIARDAEITLEANPDDITAAKLRCWKDAGINRLSVGVQSFSDTELAWMNRAHTAADSLQCIAAIEDAGFTNYSIDLIYGSPLLGNDAWEKTVDTVIKKNIPHISCYALTVEPGTALDKMIAQHKKAPTDAEKQAAQFLMLIDWMEKAGYQHYEISNFARPGNRSRHNSSYWLGKYYYGFGPSAHSYDGQRRKWNVANNVLYIQSLKKNELPFEEELLNETQKLNEYIMMALRTMEGIDLDQVSKRFGTKYSEKLQPAGSKYIDTGKLQQTNSRLVLTREGKLFADGIAADLFF